MAAATEYYNKRENDDPGAVVIENMAKAVVIHMILQKTFLM